MTSLHSLILHLIICQLFSLITESRADPLNAPDAAVIERDVCIIGGGASGTYAAIRLQELGKTVVLIEKEAILGGHTNTYLDPKTNKTIDYGVQIYNNIPIVTSFFSKLSIPVHTTILSGSQSLAVDFQTGLTLTNLTRPDAAASQLALGIYVQQLLKYPYILDGSSIPLPVPEDLLLSFGDFVEKYSLQAIVYTVFNLAQGFGDVLQKPTFYILRYFSLQFIQDLQTGFLSTVDNDNAALYSTALRQLGSNALLNTTVSSMTRANTTDGVAQITTKSTSGSRDIRAKRIIIAIPPKLSNLKGVDLSPLEKDLFSQFTNSAYYTAIVRIPGLTTAVQYDNHGLNTTYNLPKEPSIYNIIPTEVSDLYSLTYGARNEGLDTASVKNQILDDVHRVINRTGTFNSSSEVTFTAFANHSPYGLDVPATAIEAGFYQNLSTIQGSWHTYYIGAAFYVHNSALLWNYTEGLIPSIIEGL